MTKSVIFKSARVVYSLRVVLSLAASPVDCLVLATLPVRRERWVFLKPLATEVRWRRLYCPRPNDCR